MENVYPEFNYKIGRPLKYQPEELIEKFKEYIEWARSNPIIIGKSEAGETVKGAYSKETTENKPRLVSISGFLVFLGASFEWWQQLDQSKTAGEKFFKVKAFIRDYCLQYQKEMASNDIFNANIVSRLLGITDKTSEGITIIVKTQDEAKKLRDLDKLDV